MGEDERLDLELHRRVSERDRGAFDELYRRYVRQAYGVALRVTSQDLIAQEVVQDAFLALWRAPEAFDPARGGFRSFFLSLVHHRAVDAVRREERLRRRTERAANLEPATGEDPAEDVVEDAYLRVRRQEVRASHWDKLGNRGDRPDEANADYDGDSHEGAHVHSPCVRGIGRLAIVSHTFSLPACETGHNLKEIFATPSLPEDAAG